MRLLFAAAVFFSFTPGVFASGMKRRIVAPCPNTTIYSLPGGAALVKARENVWLDAGIYSSDNPFATPGWVQVYLRTTPVFKGPFYIKKADYECAVGETDSLMKMP